METLSRAIEATVEDSASQQHLALDTENLRKLLSCLATDETKGSVFCRELLSVIRTCFSISDQSQCRVELRENALKQFHVLRVSELPALWSALCVDVSVNCPCPVLLQSVNRRVFEHLLIEHFSESAGASSASVVTGVPLMTAEEENALRYVSGYVALKLMRRYEKEEDKITVQYVECLSSMAVAGEESSFYNYTKEWWTCLIDRGGLFHVNDGTYDLFKSIEFQVRQVLTPHLKNSLQSTSTSVIDKVKEDEDVQFHWSMMSTDVHDHQDADRSLQEIIKLYITIRGHSLTATWMEQYKRASQQSSSKKRGLRKNIQYTTEFS